jgi:hypothetical protein
MAGRDDERVRIKHIYYKKGESLKRIDARVRRAFTAADLQRYTEIEEGVPMAQVMAELEAIQREESPKRKKRREKPRPDRPPAKSGTKRVKAREPQSTTRSRAMPERKKRSDGIPRLYVKKGESLKSIYARFRREFTAADLQKYTEIEEGIPMEKIIAELEEIHRKASQKRKKKA